MVTIIPKCYNFFLFVFFNRLVVSLLLFMLLFIFIYFARFTVSLIIISFIIPGVL